MSIFDTEPCFAATRHNLSSAKTCSTLKKYVKFHLSMKFSIVYFHYFMHNEISRESCYIGACSRNNSDILYLTRRPHSDHKIVRNTSKYGDEETCKNNTSTAKLLWGEIKAMTFV